MTSFIAKLCTVAFGLSLVVAPLSASAAQIGIGIHVGGRGYGVHGRYVNPGGPCYGCGRRVWAPPPPRRYGWRPAGWRHAPVALYDGYYGAAPGGYYGYYWHGGWYSHRRWGNGLWIYF